ncbi:MAG TPA: SpoIIIAH-like family protein [Bacillota bacterium]|nr:SpoIIIAH-like family protein [Bacillota bacterium]
MLKKQTVWLLTMLSLMVVLSAYYILSEPDEQDLSLFDEDFNDLNVLNDTSNDIETEVTNITNEQPDEYFAMLRMEIQNERSMSKERYNNIVKSSSASTEEKNDALNQIQEIDETTTKETILQERILALTDSYEDVLVRYSNDKLHVHVQTDDLSPQEANHIMQLARSEFGEIPVEVNYNP